MADVPARASGRCAPVRTACVAVLLLAALAVRADSPKTNETDNARGWVSSTHLFDTGYDGKMVGVQGVVQDCRIGSGDGMELVILAGHVPVHARVPARLDGEPETLIDARVMAGGTLRQKIRADGAVTDVWLDVADRDALTVELPAPKDPFSVALSDVDELPSRPTAHRVRVKGRVAYVSPDPGIMMLRESDGGQIEVHVRGRNLAEVGDVIDVVGFIAHRSGVPTLENTIVHIVAPRPWWTPAKVAFVVGFLLLAAVGAALHQLLQRLRAKRDAEAVHRERMRISFDLHDDMQQLLAGTMCHIKAAENFAGRGLADRSAEQLKRARETLAHAQTGLRRILWGLQGESEGADSLMAMLTYVAKYLPQWKGVVSFETHGDERPISRKATTNILMTLQEAVGNALRHGRATRVKVCADYTAEGLVLTVGDDGCGFDPATLRPDPGKLGLRSMETRAREVGASVSVNSAVGEGTVITIRVPYDESDKVHSC